MDILNKEVSFDLAKLLKECKFKNTTPTKLHRPYYNHKGEYDGDVTDLIKAIVDKKDTTGYTIDAPSISEVIDWIYTNYNIWISVDFDSSYWFEVITFTDKNDRWILNKHDNPYNAYISAITSIIILKNK